MGRCCGGTVKIEASGESEAEHDGEDASCAHNGDGAWRRADHVVEL